MIKLRKLRNAVWFIIIVIIIFGIYIFIYKNIDILIPKREDIGHAFPIEEREQNTEFLNQLADYISTYDYYRKASNDIVNIQSNQKLNKLLTYIHNGSEENMRSALDNMLVGTIYDTIYGDLNIIIQRYSYYKTKKESWSIQYMIAYSDDMSKIFYLNNSKNLNNTMSSVNSATAGENELKIYDAEMITSGEEGAKQEDLTMSTIMQLAREKFLVAIPNMEFNPNTIMYNKPYYILEDTENDITIYYDNYYNDIYGLYIGFGNQ